MDVEFRLPKPHELVGSSFHAPESVVVAFVAFGSQGAEAYLRVVDANGQALGHKLISSGSSGEYGGPYALNIELTTTPTTPDGAVEYFRGSRPTGAPAVTVPVQFGTVIMVGYYTYSIHTVVAGETLWSIAASEYKHGSGPAVLWPYIHQANHHQISDPDVITVGQRLFIPRSTDTEYDHG